jgi:hypothetical protein
MKTLRKTATYLQLASLEIIRGVSKTGAQYSKENGKISCGF